MNLDATYLTLSNDSEGFYKEKGSKFFSYAFPVKNEEEIKAFLDMLRKKHHDARHHCYAYVLGKNKDVFRVNDDGEPHHSAGDPIFGQIKSNGLTNVLIVVVRYFGGTKLGVGGLITAYKTAAADAITNNQIIEKEDRKVLSLRFEYLEMNHVMKVIKDYDLEISNQELDNSCKITLQVPEGICELVIEKLNESEGVTLITD